MDAGSLDQDPTRREPEDSEQADEIIRAIRRIVQSISIHSKKLKREVGLTLPQMLCLKAIAEAGPNHATIGEVSRRIQLRPATLTGIVDRLEREGLLRRERGSADRRKVYLELTEAGQGQLATQPSTLQDRFLSRLASLQPSERQQLLDSLQIVVKLIDASTIDAAPILITGDVKTGG